VIRLTKPSNLVRRRKDGTLWTADGACPFPMTGWNFARCVPRAFGWSVRPLERFVTVNKDEFDILWSL
jgi:hypothetical protein